MFIKIVLLAIVAVLLLWIVSDIYKRSRARRSLEGSPPAKRDNEDPSAGAGDTPEPKDK
jgi:hypothetical protein